MRRFQKLIFASRTSLKIFRNAHHKMQERTLDSSLGICYGSDEFTQLQQPARLVSSDGPDEKVLFRWLALAEGILQADQWQNVGSRLKKILNHLPEKIVEIYDDLESSTGIVLEHEQKKTYYNEFRRMAEGFAVLNFWEVDLLLANTKVSAGINDDVLHCLMRDRVEQSGGSSMKPESVNGSAKQGVFDFELFATLVYDVIKHKQNVTNSGTARVSLQDFLPLDPDNKRKQLWDCFVMSLLLYCCFEVPFSIAFDTLEHGESLTAIQLVDVLVDVVLLVDMLLCFVTSFERQGYMVLDLSSIAQNYLKTWFVADFAGSFPFDIVITVILPATSSLQALRVLKLVRMIKVLRALRFLDRLNKLKRKKGFEHSSTVIGVFKSIFVMVFTANLLGCMFIMMLMDSPTYNWMVHYAPDAVDGSIWARYSIAMYWAIVTISTMGYGDIVPVTYNERIFVIFVALIGAIVFSYCMGNISFLILQRPSKDDRLRDKIREVGEYLQFRDISSALKRKILSFYASSWRLCGELYDESEILGQIPTPLRQRVLSEVGVNCVKELDIFQGFEDDCVGYIVSRLKRACFTAGDVIYHRGQAASEMFLVIDGVVTLDFSDGASRPMRRNALQHNNIDQDTPGQYFSHGRKRKGIEITAGGTFGEVALFPDLMEPIRYERAVAASLVSVYILSTEQLDTIQEKYPLVQQRLKELCRLKALEYRECNPNTEDSGSTPQGSLCKINVRIAELKRDLLRRKEANSLKTTAGQERSDILRLMWRNPSNAGGNDKSGWHGISLVVSEEGELLCIEHSVEGLEQDEPISLGFLVPAKSTYAAIGRAERYGRRRGKEGLHGCSVVVFRKAAYAEALSRASGSWAFGSLAPTPNEAAGAMFDGDESSVGDERLELELFTWSDEEYQSLLEVLAEWLGPPSSATQHLRVPLQVINGGRSDDGSVHRAKAALRTEGVDRLSGSGRFLNGGTPTKAAAQRGDVGQGAGNSAELHAEIMALHRSLGNLLCKLTSVDGTEAAAHTAPAIPTPDFELGMPPKPPPRYKTRGGLRDSAGGVDGPPGPSSPITASIGECLVGTDSIRRRVASAEAKLPSLRQTPALAPAPAPDAAQAQTPTRAETPAPGPTSAPADGGEVEVLDSSMRHAPVHMRGVNLQASATAHPLDAAPPVFSRRLDLARHHTTCVES